MVGEVLGSESEGQRPQFAYTREECEGGAEGFNGLCIRITSDDALCECC